MKDLYIINDFEFLPILKEKFHEYKPIIIEEENITEIVNKISSNNLLFKEKILLINNSEIFSDFSIDLFPIFNNNMHEVIMISNNLINQDFLQTSHSIKIHEKNFDLNKEVQKIIKNNAITIENQALKLLCFNLDNKFSLIYNELLKLSLTNFIITIDTINNNSYKLISANFFHLVCTLATKDILSSESIIKELYSLNYSDIQIITGISFYLNKLIVAKIMINEFSHKNIIDTLYINDNIVDQFFKIINQADLDWLFYLNEKLLEKDIFIRGNQ